MLPPRAPDNPDDEVVADFRAAYEEKFDHEPKPIDTYALMVYDTLLMLAQAVEDAGTSTDIAAISTALRDRKTVEWGKSVSVRVVLGGFQYFKKKTILITLVTN